MATFFGDLRSGQDVFFRQADIRMKAFIIGLSFFFVTAGSSLGGKDDQVWIGQHFRPEQLVALRDGEATFARKLCTIHYRMHRRGDHFTVEGRLTFDPRFVPRRPRAIDLEILLINAAHVCTRQIDRHLEVTADQVVFVFKVPQKPLPQYLRTYYTLLY